MKWLIEFKKEFNNFLISLSKSIAFDGTILTIIALDSLCIGIQASEFIARKSTWYIEVLHLLFLAVYVLELVVQVYALRLNYFKDLWNDFSLILITVDLVGLLVPFIVHRIGVFDFTVFQVLRVVRIIQALRALRVIKTIKFIVVPYHYYRFLRNLNIIVLTLLESIPAIGAIVITISLVLYIFAVVGRDLYGSVDPPRYGNLGRAIFTLFQLITLDDWFQMYSDINPGQEHILVFLILFIAIETLIFINLFVAVIVDNLARAQSTSDVAEFEDNLPKGTKDGMDLEDPMDERIAEGTATLSGHMHKFGSGYESIDDLSKEYLLALASLEHHFVMAHKHRTTLNKLVDIVDLSKS